MIRLQGLVLKNYNGYYYVKASTTGCIYTCKVKGRMKQNRFSIVTGDSVFFETEGTPEGMIVEVAPRRNFLPRPAVANLDLLFVEFACVSPDFSFLLADKLLLSAAQAGIEVVLLLNKCELVDKEAADKIKNVYEAAGYEVLFISAKNNIGMDSLRRKLYGKICAFAGPSGVGKSSTINAVDGCVNLRTGAVSEKIRRGKHTTRYAQLLPFAEGYLVDTPGFGNLLPEGLLKEDVSKYFPEFAAYENACRFRPCTHVHEPICGVKAAVTEGKISATRYASYKFILEELEEIKEREGRKSW